MKQQTFQEQKKKYLKATFNELKTNRKIKNIRNLYRDIKGCEKGYQPSTNIGKVDSGDLVRLSQYFG